ncbi:putative Sporulation-specific N-acetylmuramoyl-L-alanine amidase [Blattamonas nauphoetae]|uniref:Sporulation-specific N-acetylmuramoyl-L-alanine amidase n=1 Tax=Blattamonas nauphoetae TaxID=2049346 RepID=A0ABQ9Y8C2_9EUKA|nr:putative Sporulation-specific N-acetylmuramoyl-L-alanine amidase [Blattamonas nauphoetae]
MLSFVALSLALISSSSAVKIFIDPGHGGSDPGAVANGLREKDLTLTISNKVAAGLRRVSGCEVKLSRTTDVYLSLSQRAQMANSWGARFFISIHINAGGGTGFESYRHQSNTADSRNIQAKLHPKIVGAMGVRDRGQKMANFAVLRDTTMSAILTENMFIDTAADAAKLKQAAFIEKIVSGHVAGIRAGVGF